MSNQSTTVSQSDILLEDRFIHSIFWATELEVLTRSDRPELTGSFSDAEVMLDAFNEHQERLLQELDQLHSGQDGTELMESVRSGSLTRLTLRIKVCHKFIRLLSNSLAGDLRQLGNSISHHG